ncbi:hypothetical protein ScalyP_jg7451 [Parmales sp. scaly parma]|nr:hypothetical protein ScalyP_jg7451 [Parmales sp. scaly parma]
MCCPIFQDLLSDPVVAEDGNTYSREAITKWFATNPTKVSPVTNALMKNINLTPNLAIMGMVRRFKEEAGHELLVRCENMERWTDDGQRALALIDAGADLTLRSTSPPPSPHYLDTAMMIILKKTNLPLVHKIVIESFNIQSLSLLVKSNTNQTCVEIVQHKLLTSNFDPITKKGWTVILAELAKREAKEKKDLAKQHKVRDRQNAAQRREQDSLSASARGQNTRNASENFITINGQNIDLGTNNGRGLGQFTSAWGYFPSLFTLQFLSHVPPAPASFQDAEKIQKKKLVLILQFITFCIFAYLVIA